MVSMLVLLLPVAVAWCQDGYSCCCGYVTLLPGAGIPYECECVEDEPGLLHRNNCDRDGNRSTPSVFNELIGGNKSALLHGLCQHAPSVSLQDLDKRKAADAAWEKHFTESCVDNGAHCSAAEHCWYDGKQPGGTHQTVYEIEKGAQCVCSYPRGRDAEGQCVDCPHADCDGKPCEEPAFVTLVPRTPGDGPPGFPGTKTFTNGEFHCALAAVHAQGATVLV